MKIGDRVRIINYGHAVFTVEQEYKTDKFPLIKTYPDGTEARDMAPELVGQEGTITQVSKDGDQYILLGPSKAAWYNEEQLELIAMTEGLV